MSFKQWRCVFYWDGPGTCQAGY